MKLIKDYPEFEYYIHDDRVSRETPHIAKEVFDDEIYSRPYCQVERGDIVLDIGANLGFFAIYALTVKHANRVICVEADKTLNQLIWANAELHGVAHKIEIVNCAVMGTNGGIVEFERATNWYGTGHLASIELDKNNFNPPLETEIVTVEGKTIDRIVEEKVDFIKFDIEGGERQAFDGMENVMKRYRPKIAAAAYHLEDDKIVLRKKIKDMPHVFSYDIKYHYFGRWSEVMFAYPK